MADRTAGSCGCGVPTEAVQDIYYHLNMAQAPLAMAYVPFQQWEEPLPLCRGFQSGTVFSSLNKPFCGKGGKRW